MDNELKPCPHCGSNMRVRCVTYPNGDTAYRVTPDSFFGSCYVCWNLSDIDDDDWDEFVNAWNRRAE